MERTLALRVNQLGFDGHSRTTLTPDTVTPSLQGSSPPTRSSHPRAIRRVSTATATSSTTQSSILIQPASPSGAPLGTSLRTSSNLWPPSSRRSLSHGSLPLPWALSSRASWQDWQAQPSTQPLTEVTGPKPLAPVPCLEGYLGASVRRYSRISAGCQAPDSVGGTLSRRSSSGPSPARPSEGLAPPSMEATSSRTSPSAPWAGPWGRRRGTGWRMEWLDHRRR